MTDQDTLDTITEGIANDQGLTFNNQGQLESLHITITHFDRITMNATGHDPEGNHVELDGTYAFGQLDFYNKSYQYWLSPTEWTLKA